jgi:hypothetical protein
LCELQSFDEILFSVGMLFNLDVDAADLTVEMRQQSSRMITTFVLLGYLSKNINVGCKLK